MKATTVRQTDEQADELEVVARVDGVPVAEVIRVAIATHLAARRADPEFQRRLRERLAADKNYLNRLVK